jgi:hypothetical protein
MASKGQPPFFLYLLVYFCFVWVFYVSCVPPVCLLYLLVFLAFPLSPFHSVLQSHFRRTRCWRLERHSLLDVPSDCRIRHSATRHPSVFWGDKGFSEGFSDFHTFQYGATGQPRFFLITQCKRPKAEHLTGKRRPTGIKDYLSSIHKTCPAGHRSRS